MGSFYTFCLLLYVIRLAWNLSMSVHVDLPHFLESLQRFHGVDAPTFILLFSFNVYLACSYFLHSITFPHFCESSLSPLSSPSSSNTVCLQHQADVTFENNLDLQFFFVLKYFKLMGKLKK